MREGGRKEAENLRGGGRGSQRSRGQDGKGKSHILEELLEFVMGATRWRIMMVPWELVMGQEGLLGGLAHL